MMTAQQEVANSKVPVTQINSAVNIHCKELKLYKGSMNNQQNNKNSASDCELAVMCQKDWSIKVDSEP